MLRLIIALAVAFLTSTASAQEFKVGSKLSEFTISNESGPITVTPAKSAATLVIFVSNKCPVSNAYNSRMNQLRRDYTTKNVNVVFVNPNINETNEDMQSLADTTKLGGIVYRDVDNKFADQLNASFTPEAYVFDAEGTLRYHGSIDNSQNESRVSKKPLREALDAVLDKKEVATTTTRAFGCTIKRKKS